MKSAYNIQMKFFDLSLILWEQVSNTDFQYKGLIYTSLKWSFSVKKPLLNS